MLPAQDQMVDKGSSLLMNIVEHLANVSQELVETKTEFKGA